MSLCNINQIAITQLIFLRLSVVAKFVKLVAYNVYQHRSLFYIIAMGF
jgi:hypothetical protein